MLFRSEAIVEAIKVVNSLLVVEEPKEEPKKRTRNTSKNKNTAKNNKETKKEEKQVTTKDGEEII